MKATHFLLASLVFCAAFAGSRAAFAQAAPAAKPAPSAVVTVPFVGCASDGQAGPQAAPARASQLAAVPPALAQRLAFYEAKYGYGVLAPRGWHCFSTYGSDGSNLFVSPDPVDSKTLLSLNWKGFTGQAVQVSYVAGDTSGRFEVAKVIARVFPEYKGFAQGVIAEGIEPASDFPFGPYPSDKLTYRGNSAVEFETPANIQGLGTDSRLQMNANPIDGAAIITDGVTDLIHLTVRLSGRDLIPVIVRQVEAHEGVPVGN
jgi:hypothetical protein